MLVMHLAFMMECPRFLGLFLCLLILRLRRDEYFLRLFTNLLSLFFPDWEVFVRMIQIDRLFRPLAEGGKQERSLGRS